MTERRLFFNVVTDDLPAATALYRELFGFVPSFESDWFVQLRSPDNAELELGFLRRDHEIVPDSLRTSPPSGMLTLTVDDVDAVHARAQAMGLTILEAPRDLFFGQRRLLLVDPSGLTVDVSSPCPPDPEWMKRVRPADGGGYVEG